MRKFYRLLIFLSKSFPDKNKTKANKNSCLYQMIKTCPSILNILLNGKPLTRNSPVVLSRRHSAHTPQLLLPSLIPAVFVEHKMLIKPSEASLNMISGSSSYSFPSNYHQSIRVARKMK